MKPDKKFLWDDAMERSFCSSKTKILEDIVEGVKMYDNSLETMLVTDWSRTGMGFSLIQKTCSCMELKPNCCKSGWRVTYCGSKFCNPAESRYHPVEGEALAAAWALKKTAHWTLGCSKLTLAVDHKPLLKLFGDRELGEIDNPRLLNFKEKTLPFRFKVVHVPGDQNKTADGVSRNPVAAFVSALGYIGGTTEADLIETERLEQKVKQSVKAACALVTVPRAFTWEELLKCSSEDLELKELNSLVKMGVPEKREDWPEKLEQYYPGKDFLDTMGTAVTYKGRLVVPAELRPAVLKLLHSCHQGASTMIHTAADTVYWPNMCKEMRRVRESCRSCDITAPSQPSAPPVKPPAPSFPFQQVCCDFFELEGKSFCVFVDRYSNWISIYRAQRGTTGELLKELRNYTATFGIMEEISTDRGTQFMSGEFKSWCKQFGVQHRLSAAYNPHSNQRAEGAVKQAKRIIRDHLQGDGTLDTSGFVASLLRYRNAPDKDSNLSPAQVLFGRWLRDFLPITPGQLHLHPQWLPPAAERGSSGKETFQKG